jgi:hypothetical protein
MNVKKCKQCKHHRLSDRINCKTTFRLRGNPTTVWCMQNHQAARTVETAKCRFEKGDANA